VTVPAVRSPDQVWILLVYFGILRERCLRPQGEKLFIEECAICLQSLRDDGIDEFAGGASCTALMMIAVGLVSKASNRLSCIASCLPIVRFISLDVDRIAEYGERL
jgi:hypothetical protein